MAKIKNKTIVKLGLKVSPAAGYILLEPEEAMRETASGIVLPQTASGEKPQKGKVLSVGKDEVMEGGVMRVAPCRAGDTVYYKKWGGNEIKIQGEEYLFVKFEDILAVEG